MAGGTFDKMVGKARPGTYLNFESNNRDVIGYGERGAVFLPLTKLNYGPAKEPITLTAAAPDAAYAKLGYSIYDKDPNRQMLLIREAFKKSTTVVVYITSSGEKASKTSGSLTATAPYGGSRGNNLSFAVIANPLGGFDVEIYLDGNPVINYEGITTIEELAAKNCEFITFSGTGALEAVAGARLEGGTDTPTTNADVTAFLDAAEGVKFNTMAFPISEETLKAACKTKIKYLRENVGKKVKAVVANYKADFEGIINVTNSVKVDGEEISAEEATAWVAGADAGASNTTSNTYAVYDGATEIVGVKTNEEAIAAINNGEFFFSYSEAGDVVAEYDINSLTTFTDKKDETYRKNRVIRVFDTFAESVQLNFPPNKYNNNPSGWDVMDGIGRTILKSYEETGAIKNVDYDADFAVDRTLSEGDKTYFNVGLTPVDSSEKLFFTIATR